MATTSSTHPAGTRPRFTTGVSVPVVLLMTLSVTGLSSLACQRSDQSPKEHDLEVNTAWFEDMTAASGVGFIHESGQSGRFWFPEIMTGGVGLFDYDGDGLLDVYCVQGGGLELSESDAPTNKLYRNRGDWTFEDVTERAGVGDDGYGMGCACGDYDNDGDVDLYVTNVGRNVLYCNNADGTFTDVTEIAGVGDASWGTSCAFADYDGDGDLDLFVVNYVHWSSDHELECVSPDGRRDYCSPQHYRAPARDTLYRNMGDGTFSDVSVSAGLGTAFGNGLGIACGDFNLDGQLDFYVANDATANQLWINRGEGRFTDEAMISGCALNHYGWAEAGMGVAAVDLENDGDLDLFLSHLHEETNTFYLNNDGFFQDVTSAVGLANPSRGMTGFGLGFADFDHDGVLDLYVANGRVKLGPHQLDPSDAFAEPNQLFRGVAPARFEEVMPHGGTSPLLVAPSRAAAFGDLDNDGDTDIVVINKDARPHLLRNLAGVRGNWVMFRLRSRLGTEAAGAFVRIAVAGQDQRRLAQRAYSYCASNDPRVHFGLGDANRVDSVTVRWTNAVEETFGAFDAGHEYELREGAGDHLRSSGS